MLRAIGRFCARQWQKQQDVNARRRPDRNICCKCGYDLTGVAETPPAKSAPDVVCPECGKAIALREHWWTDGRVSMKKWLVISIVLSSLIASLGIASVAQRHLMDIQSAGASVYFAFAQGGIVIVNVLACAATVLLLQVSQRDVATQAHIRRRFICLAAPLIGSFLLVWIVYRIAPTLWPA